MGGIGAILAFGVGSILYEANTALPFIVAGVITLLCLFIVSRYIKEHRDGVNQGQETAHTEANVQPNRISFRGQLDRTTGWLLAAIFFWFVAYQGVETLFTLYGKHHLGLSEQAASFSLTFFSLAFVLFAIPSGWLGARFGKKKMIILGVCGLIAVYSLVGFAKDLLVLRSLLLLGGLFWACININSYPYVVATGTEESIGTRTGMYYLVSSLAAITSPPLLGLLIDQFDYSILFYVASVSMVVALFCLIMMTGRRKSASRFHTPGA